MHAYIPQDTTFRETRGGAELEVREPGREGVVTYRRWTEKDAKAGLKTKDVFLVGEVSIFVCVCACEVAGEVELAAGLTGVLC